MTKNKEGPRWAVFIPTHPPAHFVPISLRKVVFKTNALSFYGSKMILDCPNNFSRVPIVLDGSKSFWSGPKHFGQVQIIKVSP